MRPALEVAEIFRRHGAAFRQQHRLRLGRVERRVMAAIETCRTSALGGHVEQCGDCGLVRCTYNSCLMGKISNGESAGDPLQANLHRRYFAPHNCRCSAGLPIASLSVRSTFIPDGAFNPAETERQRRDETRHSYGHRRVAKLS